MAIYVLFHTPYQPTENMYYALLRVCSDNRALEKAKLIQSHLSRDQLETAGFLGEYLVITLVKCGGIHDAVRVFDRMSHRTVYCWTAIISGFVECGKFQDALDMYPLMQQDGVEPNDYTFVSLLKACGSVHDLEMGKRLHVEALKHNYGSESFVGTSLIDMYAKCRSIALAQNAFDALFEHSVVSWTALLSAYVDYGQAERALELYEQMLLDGVSPDDRTFVIALQACYVLAEDDGAAREFALKKGRTLHAHAWIRDYDCDIFVGNALVSLYGKYGGIVDAENVFVTMPNRDTVSWNALLFAYVEEGFPQRALHLLRQMKEDGITSDDRTFVSSLSACIALVENEEGGDSMFQSMKEIALEIGQALHSESKNKGLDRNVFVGHTLVNLYGSCAAIDEAENAFLQLIEHSVVSWTMMCMAYLRQGNGIKALQAYRVMQEEAVMPNDQTLCVALRACCLLAENDIIVENQSIKHISLMIGRALSIDAKRRGFNLDIFASCALVIMHEKCGCLEDANDAFSEFPENHVAIWNAILSAYVNQDDAYKALQWYEKMQEKGVTPTYATLLFALQACSKTGSLKLCREIHFIVVAFGFETRMTLANTFIHAYGNCASIGDAQSVFDLMAAHDVASWNALIGGYALQGDWETSLHVFKSMKQTFVKPDTVTFTSVLSACCHGGLVQKGVEHLKLMSRHLNLTPDIGHYSSILDLLGKAGDFMRMTDLLSSLPMQPDFGMCLSFLGACQAHGNVKFARYLHDQAVLLRPNQATAYVMTSTSSFNAD